MHTSISALVDGQITDLDLPRVLKQLNSPANQQQALAKWQSFHTVSNVLQKKLPQGQALKFTQVNLSARVMEQLKQEAVISPQEDSLKSQWLKTSALAASVALLVLAGAQVYNLLPLGSLNQIEVAEQLTNPINQELQQVTWVGECQSNKLTYLTKPPYLAQSSRLPERPCNNLTFTPFNSSAISKVQYSPINAP